MCALVQSCIIFQCNSPLIDSYSFHLVRRRRSEFWTSGNDISREGSWVWSEAGERRVEEEVWLEPALTSLEENCLVWSLSRGREGGLSSACCNNIRYICQAGAE